MTFFPGQHDLTTRPDALPAIQPTVPKLLRHALFKNHN